MSERPARLGDLVRPVAEGAPGRAAMVIGSRAITFRQLEDGVASAAAALGAAGFGAGDRVGLVDECSLLFVSAVLGAARVGAAAAPMNHRLTAGELGELRDAAELCGVAVAGDAYVAAAEAAFGSAPLGGAEVLGRTGTAPAAEVPDHAQALVLFTSGTTGLPKAVPLTHRWLLARIFEFSAPFDPEQSPQVALLCLPVVHVGGLVGLLVALAAGTTTVVQRRFDAGEWLRLVEEHRVQRTFLVPTMLHRILDHPEVAARDLSSLVTVAYGAAPAAPDLVRRAVDALPHVMFTNVFGQTETLGAVTVLLPDDHRPGSAKIGSVGRPLPGVDLRVVHPETAEDVPPGEVGELSVRQGGDWHRTGDLVRRDADGYLWAEGRLSDTINRGGEKVAPSEVEVVLREHTAVADCAVAGVPDEEMGERIGAAVVLRGEATADELRTWCRERLAPFKVPERIAFVDEIPHSDLGKVSRPEIARVVHEQPGPA